MRHLLMLWESPGCWTKIITNLYLDKASYSDIYGISLCATLKMMEHKYVRYPASKIGLCLMVYQNK